MPAARWWREGRGEGRAADDGEPRNCLYSPGYPSAFHVIGQGHVVAPNIELPFPQAEHPAMYPTRVDPHSHIHVHGHYLAYQSAQHIHTRTHTHTYIHGCAGQVLFSCPTPHTPATALLFCSLGRRQTSGGGRRGGGLRASKRQTDSPRDSREISVTRVVSGRTRGNARESPISVRRIAVDLQLR